MDAQSLIQIAHEKANKIGVDADLAVAIMTEESSLAWPRCSSRFEPNFKYIFQPEVFASRNGITVETEKAQQSMSWGPMHVMGGSARELGFNDPLPILFDPAVGIEYGCKKLKAISELYKTEAAVIAAYNAGSPRKMILPGQSVPTAEYVNQKYVDSVTARLKVLRKIQ